MGEIVNLRRVRKARARAESAQHAAENRAINGVSKAERDGQSKRRSAAEKALDHAHVLPLAKEEEPQS